MGLNILLKNLSYNFLAHQNSVRVHDCVQPVCDGEDSAVGELLTKGFLNNTIGPTK